MGLENFRISLPEVHPNLLYGLLYGEVCFGLTSIVGILGVVDRMEGGRKTIEEAGYSVQTMTTIRDLGVEPDSPG